MQKIALGDGAKLNATVAGDGTDLVLISGLGGMASFWDPLVVALGDGFRIIRFDQRGIAGSDRGNVPITIETLARDTWELLDALGCIQPLLFGHSTGGAIAQLMTWTRPKDVRAVILNGTWAGPNWYMEALFSVRRELLAHAPEQYAKFSTLIAYPPRWLNEHLDVYQTATQSPPDQYLVDVISERIDVLLEHDCRSILSNLQIPALVMGTEDDQIVPPHLQQELASLLPRAQLHLFSHGGHLFPITRPRDVVVRMIDWLSRGL